MNTNTRRWWASWWWGVAVVLCSGCCSNLQASYVRSNQAAYDAIMADVAAGAYKADAQSKQTLEGWRLNNSQAEQVLRAEGKWGQ